MYNIIGQKVAVIMADYLSSGDYELNYDCQDLASGIYFLSVKTMENIGLEKLVLLK
jgi:hypothetical protein